jgi:hypothetical protein
VAKHPVDNPSLLGIVPRTPSRSSEPHVRLRTDHLYRRPPPTLRGRNASGIEALSDLAQACSLGTQLSHDRSHVLSSHKISPYSVPVPRRAWAPIILPPSLHLHIFGDQCHWPRGPYRRSPCLSPTAWRSLWLLSPQPSTHTSAASIDAGRPL